ncbi:MAG: single-stranded DNA-binding protein [Bacteroidetes bacterium]|nr:single-stranded DNA-binding protein [Bacteroidota bacterium]
MKIKSINKVTLLGHVGKAEVKTTQSNYTILTFSLATNENDQCETTTTWHSIKVFKPTEALQRLNSGDAVLVEGRLREEKWETDGVKKSNIVIYADTVNIIFTKDESGNDAGTKGNGAPDVQGFVSTDEDLPY